MNTKTTYKYDNLERVIHIESTNTDIGKIYSETEYVYFDNLNPSEDYEITTRLYFSDGGIYREINNCLRNNVLTETTYAFLEYQAKDNEDIFKKHATIIAKKVTNFADDGFAYEKAEEGDHGTCYWLYEKEAPHKPIKECNPSSDTDYEYDEKGQLIKRTTAFKLENAGNAICSRRHVIDYHYDEKGKLISQTEYDL